MTRFEIAGFMMGLTDAAPEKIFFKAGKGRVQAKFKGPLNIGLLFILIYFRGPVFPFFFKTINKNENVTIIIEFD